MRTLPVFLLGSLSVVFSGREYIGVWDTAPYSLPGWELPDVPLSGNGKLGVLYDSWGARGHGAPPAPGYGKTNALDIWFSSNSFWSCAGCTSASPGCCAKAALGGLSIVSAALGLNFLNMSQEIATGTLRSVWATAHGGVFSTSTLLHPVHNVALTSLAYAPGGAGDPPVLTLNVSTWVLGASAHRARPLPGSVACFPLPPAALPTNTSSSCAADAAPAIAAATRLGSSVGGASTPRPVWAGLASGVVAPGAPPAAAFAAWSPPGGAPGCFPCVGPAWGVDVLLPLAAGATAYVVTAEAETASYAPESDPALPAAQLLAPFLSAAGVASIQADAAAFWGKLYSVSSVSLPTMPLLETLWWGAQYHGAAAAPRGHTDVAPALYGPCTFTTSAPAPCTQKLKIHPHLDPLF